MAKHGSRSQQSVTLQVHQIADHCHVSTRTVQRWIKTKKLKSFQLPSGHFRIANNDFKNFLTEFNFPLQSEWFNFDQQHVVLVDVDFSRSHDMKEQFAQTYPQLKCHQVRTLWEAAILSGVLKPRLICVSLDYRLDDLNSFCRGLKSYKEIKNSLVVAIEDVSMPEVPKGVSRQFHSLMELPLSQSAFKKFFKGMVDDA